MKKTIAVIGSAAALSFAGAGLAAAQDIDSPGSDDAGSTQVEPTQTEDGQDDDGQDDDADAPEDVSDVALQLCGTISAYDFIGSAAGIVPGLSGEECEANADAAVAAAMSGDIGGALDILRGIDAEAPGDDEDAVDSGSAGLLDGFDSLSADPEGDDTGGDDTEEPAPAA